jgi:hypothetical protein
MKKYAILFIIFMPALFAQAAQPKAEQKQDPEAANAQEAIATLTALENSEERYYFTTGEYTADFSKLDVAVDGGTEPDGSVTSDNFNYGYLSGGAQRYLTAKRLEKGKILYTLYYELNEEQDGNINILCKNGGGNYCRAVSAGNLGVKTISADPVKPAVPAEKVKSKK